MARETSLIAGNVFILFFKKAVKRPSCNLVFKLIAKHLPYMCHLLVLARGSHNDLMVRAVGSVCIFLGSLLCSKTRHFARTVSLSTPEYCQSHLQNAVGGWGGVGGGAQW